MNTSVRKLLLPAVLGLAVVGAGAARSASRPAAVMTPIKVYKTPTCGCCAKWVDHMKANGFEPTVVDMPDLAGVKMESRVPAALQSCHTALVDGYVVEGHVPADTVRRLLKEKPPNVAGIAVPGMPMGSPGMEQGPRKDPYEVVAFDRTGKSRTFEKR